ncbi:MAG: DUF2752 domain-containing protein [Actinomycetota bacterium]
MRKAGSPRVSSGGQCELRLGDLRAGAGVMLAAAAARPLLPGVPGFPCPLRSLTGAPCPLCGMTTSVTAAVDFRWADSLVAAPAGLVVTALAVAVLLTGRPRVVRSPTWAVVAVLGLMWTYQLWRSPFI